MPIKRWKKEPPETWIYFVWPLLFFLSLGILAQEFFGEFYDFGIKATLFYVFFAKSFVLAGATFLFFYLFIKSLIGLNKLLQQILTTSKTSNFDFRSFSSLVFSFFYVFFGFLLASCANSIVVYQLGKTDTERVRQASLMLSKWDFALFGTHPPFAIQSWLHNIWGDLALYSYSYFTVSITLVFFGTLFTNEKLFRKFALSIILILILSAPIWYLLPAICPYEVYVLNLLGTDRSSLPRADVISSASYQANLIVFLQEAFQHWSQANLKQWAVTCFPSMHIGWGVLVVYFGCRLWKCFALVLIPFFLLNLVGTIYTLNHYAVDLPPGILSGLLAAWIAENWVERSAEKNERFQCIKLIQRDIAKLLSLLPQFSSHNS